MKKILFLLMLCLTILSCKNADDYYNDGMKKAELKDYAGAIEDFTKSIDKNPIDKESYLNRGVLYVELKKYDKAILDYDLVVLFNPSNPNIYMLRGRAKNLVLDKEGACNDFYKAKQLGAELAEDCIKLYCRDLKTSNSTKIENAKVNLEIEKATSIINKDLPKKVDDLTTATKVEYIDKENRLVFYYEVTNLKKEDKSDIEMENIIQNLKTSQLNYIKNNPKNKTFVKAKATFEYIYNDIDGVLFCNYVINPSEYIYDNN
ncbi:tetratricopeptide repeat protein [Flavobacterium sp.]|uniref:tetratricopeptide repeat protein n=1 Tax=Flavobacterium sp. TaxID=239 RepID=UPI002B4AB26B|nr:tetratricopeptide repeat protein [Flavobacterium sp.]HLF52559.1 tetratricopeptide repeat protein [Flavobacterium sp.]